MDFWGSVKGGVLGALIVEMLNMLIWLEVTFGFLIDLFRLNFHLGMPVQLAALALDVRPSLDLWRSRWGDRRNARRYCASLA